MNSRTEAFSMTAATILLVMFGGLLLPGWIRDEHGSIFKTKGGA